METQNLHVLTGQDLPPEIAEILGRLFGNQVQVTAADIVARVRDSIRSGADVETVGEVMGDAVEQAEHSARMAADVATGFMDLGVSETDPATSTDTRRSAQLMLRLTDAAQHLFQTAANALHTLVLKSAAGYMTLAADVEQTLNAEREAHADAIDDARREGYDDGHTDGYSEGHSEGYDEGKEDASDEDED